MLRFLGFSLHLVETAWVYKNKETGALVVLPVFPDEMEVLPYDLLAVRSILETYGIADPTDFALKLQKAS